MTLIFCFTRIFRNSHRHIFGLDTLIQEGYKVILLDLSEMYGGNPTADDELMLELRKKCSSKEELIDFKERFGSSPVIYICNDTYLSFTYEAFEILVRKQDRLLAFKTKPSPFQINTDRGAKLLLKNRIMKSSISPVPLTKPVYQSFRNYFVPDYFMCTTEFDLPLKALLTVKKDNIIVAHSDDVNDILEDVSEVQRQERTGVFLDQILPFAHKGKLDENVYYENLDKTLRKLKNRFGLDKIIIAEHPESAALVEELRNRHVGYERQRGKTQNLIKNSTYVFAHYSTSIGLAVFYEKPIILLTDYNLKKAPWITKAISTYQKILDLPVVDMEERDLAQLENYSVNKNDYRKYITKFMKDSKIDEKSYHYAIRKITNELNSLNNR